MMQCMECLTGNGRAGAPLRFDLSAGSFAQIWTGLHLRGEAQAVHRALRAAWREPHRHYHTTAHLRSCLQRLQCWQAAARQPHQLGLALWFHDAVYQPQRNDNEARSAQWASRVLQEAAAPRALQQRIDALIMATAHGATAAVHADADRELLLDIDLAVLGSDAADYRRYRWQVRREYAWVPAEQFRSGRSAVLRQFLAMARIYRSPCAQQLELPARRNLQHELELLRG